MTTPSAATVTFLFTDIEGSTRLWEQHPEAMNEAIARHDKVLDEAILANRGRVFSTSGDGRTAAFSTAADAVAAALAAQARLKTEEWPGTGPLRVRMGIHTGAADERDGDFLGPTVNRAARLMAVAHGGQVVCSRVTADLLGEELPEGVQLIDLGEHRLRDLARPEHVLQLTHPSLPSDFPPLSSLDAYPTNLPIQTSVFVGRERQLTEVAEALAESRIVTLSGVGGVGKTRLALQTAAELLPSYRDGAWLVELGPTVDPEVVPEVVATALGVTQRQGRSIIDSLLDFLAWKRVLIVLDNCEHLLDAVARFVETISGACSYVSVLATSREGLGVAGERMLAVPSLELPSSDSDLQRVGQAEAVRLFVQRAKEAKATFALTADNSPAVVGLCRRLDGVALAIELAAARVRSLTPAELAARLDDRFRLLAGGRRTAVERHQTLRRAIDWSYELLPEIEQRVLDRLAVFVGGFSLTAAEDVVGGDGIDASEMVDLVGRLVDKSLVSAEVEGEVTRYRLLEIIRQYAEEHLEDAGDADPLRRRHAEHYAAFAAEAGRGLRSREEVAWNRRVEAELDNLRAAVAWSGAGADVDLALRLVTPLAHVGTRVGYATNSWAEPVVAMAGASDHPLFPEALAGVAWAVALEGDLERASVLGRRALDAAEAGHASGWTMCRVLNTTAVLAVYRGWQGGDPRRAGLSGQPGLWRFNDEVGRDAERWAALARSLDDDYELSLALAIAWLPRVLSGDADGAMAVADEALAAARRLGNPTALSAAALAAGSVIGMAGGGVRSRAEAARALQLLDLAIEAGTSVGSEQVVGAALNSSCRKLHDLGDWRSASRCAVRGFEHLHRVGDSQGLAMTLANLTIELTAGGAAEAAAMLHGAIGIPLWGPVFEEEAEAVASLRSDLGADRVAELAAQGRAMDQDDLATFIRREVEPLLVDDHEERAPTAPSDRNEFRRDGDVWLLSYDQRACRLRDSKGLHYLRILLDQPGREVHVFDLVGSGVGGGGSGQTLDSEAKATYRRRLHELAAEEAEASEWGDFERADRARAETETITAELAAAYGLRGRPRTGADPTERARKAVANRIRDALARIEEAHPDLGRHLRNSVRTGTFCSYQPERPATWSC